MSYRVRVFSYNTHSTYNTYNNTTKKKSAYLTLFYYKKFCMTGGVSPMYIYKKRVSVKTPFYYKKLYRFLAPKILLAEEISRLAKCEDAEHT